MSKELSEYFAEISVCRIPGFPSAGVDDLYSPVSIGTTVHSNPVTLSSDYCDDREHECLPNCPVVASVRRGL